MNWNSLKGNVCGLIYGTFALPGVSEKNHEKQSISKINAWTVYTGTAPYSDFIFLVNYAVMPAIKGRLVRHQ